MKTKYFNKDAAVKAGLDAFPNFMVNGSIKGMKKQYYGANALLIKSGSYIYNVTAVPEIYFYGSKSTFITDDGHIKSGLVFDTLVFSNEDDANSFMAWYNERREKSQQYGFLGQDLTGYHLAKVGASGAPLPVKQRYEVNITGSGTAKEIIQELTDYVNNLNEWVKKDDGFISGEQENPCLFMSILETK